MVQYQIQATRLAERYISRTLMAKPNAELAVNDILISYENFAGRDKLDENSILNMIIKRFAPSARIRYGEIEVVEGVTWFVKEPEPAAIIKPWEEKQLELRFATMTYLYPVYAERGVSISQFADWEKFSIAAQGSILEFGKIPKDIAEKFLTTSPLIVNRNGIFFAKKAEA